MRRLWLQLRFSFTLSLLTKLASYKSLFCAIFDSLDLPWHPVLEYRVRFREGVPTLSLFNSVWSVFWLHSMDVDGSHACRKSVFT